MFELHKTLGGIFLCLCLIACGFQSSQQTYPIGNLAQSPGNPIVISAELDISKQNKYGELFTIDVSFKTIAQMQEFTISIDSTNNLEMKPNQKEKMLDVKANESVSRLYNVDTSMVKATASVKFSVRATDGSFIATNSIAFYFKRSNSGTIEVSNNESFTIVPTYTPWPTLSPNSTAMPTSEGVKQPISGLKNPSVTPKP